MTGNADGVDVDDLHITPWARVAINSIVLFAYTLVTGLATSQGEDLVREVIQACMIASLAMLSYWKTKLNLSEVP